MDRSRSPHKGSLREQQCLRCAHAWWPRRPTRSLRCPHCKSPYWDRPRRIGEQSADEMRTRIETGAAVATVKTKPDSPSDSLSFVAALELLKRLKTMGRSWSELAQELHRHCGVQLDKDQLKALLR